MSHSIEPATSGRAKCRGCRQTIAKGELRLGEVMPNPFASEGDMTHWFHLRCGALKRPEIIIEVLEDSAVEVGGRDQLLAEAHEGLNHPRLPRIDALQRSPSGRAKCRHCREVIPKDEWRVALVFYEEGTFNPAGFIHIRCAPEYFGTAEILARLQHFGTDLSTEDLAEVQTALASSTD